LTASNLGPYEQLDVPLGEGLTAVLGANMAGKTWLQIAAREVLLNDGRSYERLAHTPGAPVEMGLEFDNGLRVVRRRTGRQDKDGRWTTAKNEIEVWAPDGQHLQLSPGQGPNGTVTELTGVDVQVLAKDWKDCLTFQGANDPKFLLAEGAGRQESALARVMGVDVLEAASDILSTQLTAARRKEGAVREQVKALQTQLEPLAVLDDAEVFVVEAERQEQLVHQLSQDLEWAVPRVAAWEAGGVWVRRARAALSDVKVVEVGPLMEQQREVAQARAKVAEVQSGRAALEQLRLVSQVAVPQPIPTDSTLPAARRHCAAAESVGRFRGFVEAAGAVLSGVPPLVDETASGAQHALSLAALRQAEVDVEQTERALSQTRRRHTQALVDLGTCPTCGQATAPMVEV
jgi:DNA repair exonuclease SbcCD ATPase subunit